MMGDIPVKVNTEIGVSMTILTFVEATIVAYGTVVYGASEDKAIVVMAKVRIAPDKTLPPCQGRS